MLLQFGSKPKAFEGRLRLFDAVVTGSVLLEDGRAAFSGFIHAQKNLLVLEVDLEGDAAFDVSPDVDCTIAQNGVDTAGLPKSAASLEAWGYPRATVGSEGMRSWHAQQIPE